MVKQLDEVKGQHRLGSLVITSTLREIKSGWRSARLILWRQFSEPYRKTVLGAFWALVLPLIPVAVYIMLKLAIQNSQWRDNGIHPAVYVAVGVTIWFLLRDLFMAPVTSVQKQNTLIVQTKFHSVLAVMVGTGRALLDFVLRLIFCLPLLFIYASTTFEGAALSLCALFFAGILALSIGVWVIPLWIVLPDMIEVLNVVLRFLIFFSLAIFPLNMDGSWGLLITANPFALAIEGIRSSAFGDVSSLSWMTVFIMAILSMFSFFAGLYALGAVNDRIKEVLS